MVKMVQEWRNRAEIVANLIEAQGGLFYGALVVRGGRRRSRIGKLMSLGGSTVKFGGARREFPTSCWRRGVLRQLSTACFA
jgi:hypothetical protein